MCKSGWLSTRSEAFQEAFLNLGAGTLLQAGDVLYRRGEVPTYVHGLISGQIDMVLLSRNNEELVYPASGSDKWYSFADVITQEKAVGTAIAHKPTIMLSIPRQQFMAFLDADPARYRDIIAHDNAVRRHLQEVIADLVTFNGIELVAKRLLWMLEAGRIDEKNALMVSQQDLALSMGLSVPTVQRAFRQLKTAGILKTDYGTFYVTDRDKLEGFANTPAD